MQSMTRYLWREDVFVELEVAEVGVDHVIGQRQQLLFLEEVYAEGGLLWEAERWPPPVRRPTPSALSARPSRNTAALYTLQRKVREGGKLTLTPWQKRTLVK